MNQYVQGQVVDVTFYFHDPETRERVSPSNVTLTYGEGVTPTETLTFMPGTNVPAVGVIAELGVGNFLAQIDTTTLLGVINVQVQGSGTVQGVELRQFEVVARYY